MNEYPFKIIARVQNDFSTKFGIPRQSGIAEEIISKIVFEPEYRDFTALRGIEEFSHLWIIWMFSENLREGFKATVRPPRLGGNKRMGVFATRSPFRPNPVGLSCVKLEGIEETDAGKVLIVSGADMMDGTPVFDIKPYIPYTDCRTDASGGFSDEKFGKKLKAYIPDEIVAEMPHDKLQSLIAVLEEDPRPGYHKDEERIYAFEFAGFSVKFKVCEDIITVLSSEKL